MHLQDVMMADMHRSLNPVPTLIPEARIVLRVRKAALPLEPIGPPRVAVPTAAEARRGRSAVSKVCCSLHTRSHNLDSHNPF